MLLRAGGDEVIASESDEDLSIHSFVYDNNDSNPVSRRSNRKTFNTKSTVIPESDCDGSWS